MRVAFRGSGPLVVKLSGIAGGVGLYEEEMEAAARAGFRVAACDTSGDRRDDPAPGPLTWESLSAEVRDVIDGAGAPRAVLWGTSFGCLIALAAAARHPDRVAGLLLAHPPEPGRRPAAYEGLRDWAERRPNADLASRLLFSLWFLAMTSWEGWAPPLWARLPALARASAEARTPAATVRRKVELALGEGPGLPPPHVPVEIVAGAWDLVAPLAGARRLAACMPGARLHVMGASGHAGAYARPWTYRRIALAALRRLAEGSGR